MAFLSFVCRKDIVKKEVNYLKKLGVEFKGELHLSVKIKSMDELLKEFDAVFIGTGAGLPVFMGIPGGKSCRVFNSANEFLTRVNLMKAYDFWKL